MASLMFVQASFVAVIIGSLYLMGSSEAFDYYVGGKDGWSLNPSKPFNHWASQNRFQINDSIIFRYKNGTDSVLQVDQQDYNTCDTKNPILSLQNKADHSTFTFDHSGLFFFISGHADNCQKGQKIIILVMAPRNYTFTSPTPAPETTPISTPSPSPVISPSPVTHVQPPAQSPTGEVTHVLPPAPAPAPYPYDENISPVASPSPISHVQPQAPSPIGEITHILPPAPSAVEDASPAISPSPLEGISHVLPPAPSPIGEVAHGLPPAPSQNDEGTSPIISPSICEVLPPAPAPHHRATYVLPPAPSPKPKGPHVISPAPSQGTKKSSTATSPAPATHHHVTGQAPAPAPATRVKSPAPAPAPVGQSSSPAPSDSAIAPGPSDQSLAPEDGKSAAALLFAADLVMPAVMIMFWMVFNEVPS